MAAIFRPGANLAANLILVAAGSSIVVMFFVGWVVPSTVWATRVGFPVSQPVPFSHQHHVSGLGLDCRFCHTTVEVSATAGMPPTYTCMTCHSQLWTNADVLAPVRKSLASGKPLHWVRVNRLPDYVYFDHSIHVAKGIGCATCHGRIDEMPLTAKAATLAHVVVHRLPPRPPAQPAPTLGNFRHGVAAHTGYVVWRRAVQAVSHPLRGRADRLLGVPPMTRPYWWRSFEECAEDATSIATFAEFPDGTDGA